MVTCNRCQKEIPKEYTDKFCKLENNSEFAKHDNEKIICENCMSADLKFRSAFTLSE